MADATHEELAAAMHKVIEHANKMLGPNAEGKPRLIFAEGARDKLSEHLRDLKWPGGMEEGLLSYDGTDFEVCIYGRTDGAPPECGLTLWLTEAKTIRSLGPLGFHSLCARISPGVRLGTSSGTTFTKIISLHTQWSLDSDYRYLINTMLNLKSTAGRLDSLFNDWRELGVVTP